MNKYQLVIARIEAAKQSLLGKTYPGLIHPVVGGVRNDKKKRIFIAIKISEPLQSEILGWEKKMKALRLRSGQVRWLAGRNLHITLIPPWYIEEREIEKIKESLRLITAKPFEFHFGKVEFGPLPKTPRLIWADGQAPEGLIRLKGDLEKILGRKPEERPFLLHLTLARFRPKDFGSFSVKKLDEKVDWREDVGSFVLMESRLSRAGADYEVLAEFKLRL